MDSTEQSRSTPSPPLAPIPPRDAHIYCPHCDYDLTGAPTDRCPECGNEFDLDALVSWHRGHDQSLPANGFLEIARMSLFEPTRLGRGIPPFPHLKVATRYATRVRGLAACVIFVARLLGYIGISGLIESLSVMVLVVLSSHVCEVMLSVAFMYLVRGRAAHAAVTYPYWRTMTACFSTYLFVTCGLVAMMEQWWIPLPSNIRWLFFPLAIAWWWHGLGRAMAARTEPTTGRLVATLLIPLIGAAAVLFGLLLGALMVLLGLWCSTIGQTD